ENATRVPVDRPAQADDWLLIETLPPADSETEEPEAAAAQEQDEVTAAADESPNSSFPVDMETAGEELRTQLTGASIGDVVEVELNDEVEPNEAGEPTVRKLRIKVNDIKGKEKPAADDEFATQLGMDSWQDVEQRVRDSLTADLARTGFEER